MNDQTAWHCPQRAVLGGTLMQFGGAHVTCLYSDKDEKCMITATRYMSYLLHVGCDTQFEVSNQSGMVNQYTFLPSCGCEHMIVGLSRY